MPFADSVPNGPIPPGYPGQPRLSLVELRTALRIRFSTVIPAGATAADYTFPTNYGTSATIETGGNSVELSDANNFIGTTFLSTEARSTFSTSTISPALVVSDWASFTLTIDFGDLGICRYNITTVSSGGFRVYVADQSGGVLGSASAHEFVLPPSVEPTTGLTVMDNAPIGTVIGRAGTPMNFPAGPLFWIFGSVSIPVPTFGPFFINNSTGDLVVDGPLDATVQSVYTLPVVVEHADTGTITFSVTVTVQEYIAPPELVAATDLEVVENSGPGVIVGAAATPMNFLAGTPSWRIVDAGQPVIMAGLWAIDALSGEILTAATIPPLADADTYTVTVRLTQGGGSADTAVTIRVIVAPPVPPAPERPRHFAAWTVTFPDVPRAEGLDAADAPLRLWTGAGDLTLGDATYAGTGGLVSIGQLNAELSQPVRQATIGISLRALDPDRRRLFLGDPGSQRVEIGQVISSDGSTWTRINRTFRGRLSAPRIGDDIYQVDVVTRIADIDRGRPQFLSHEHQIALFPNDLGLEYMREFAGGVDIRWPP